ncbi:MAG: DUF3800 domain-containing protein [Deltaproteobacteria bacterium]|nr:DUF3800 domain-containing protein [Candidatus Zymogenaceae bacterium]
MKFCYFDESGMGEEAYLVIAGIIVDASRMHVTKEEWAYILGKLSEAINKNVEEFHTRDFYRGNGIWRGTDGNARAKIIEIIFDWVEDRKHKCIFSGINRSIYEQKECSDNRLQDFKSSWCAAAIHCTLQVQKYHQGKGNTKGHSVLIFDREVREETDLSLLIHKPPQWIDSFYNKDAKQTALNQIIDVPFFADSKHILLAQVADLFAYILRTSSEIQDGHLTEKYDGEKEKMHNWSERIAKISLPSSSRYICPSH